MKRKVIQIGNSTQLVSIPRKWAQRFGVKKGDEMNVTEQGSQLVLSVDSVSHDEVTEIDVSKLDNLTILHYIQSAYKSGYDEITVKFSNKDTINMKTDEKMPTMEAIHFAVARLIGAEVITQRPNHCIIRDISQTAPHEFETILRRIFHLIREMANDIEEGVTKSDKHLLDAIQERHDTATKFIAFCLRLLNKRGHDNFKQTPILFHIIASLDKVADIHKHVARKLKKHKMSPKAIDIIKGTNKSVVLYCDLYYKYKSSDLVVLSKNRREVRTDLQKSLNKLNSEEVDVCTQYVSTLDTILDLTEWRLALTH